MKIHNKRFFSIRNKILIYFITLLIPLVAAVFFLLYGRIFSVLREYAQDRAGTSIQQAGVLLENTLNNFNNMANFIAYNTQTQETLEYRMHLPYEDYAQVPYHYFNRMERIMIINYSSLILNQIEIIGDNGMIFDVPRHNPSYTDEELQLARDAAHKEEGRIFWTSFREEEFTLLKEIRSITDTSPLGCVILSVKQDYLNRQLASLLSESGSFFVLDRDGNFVCGEASYVSAETVTQAFAQQADSAGVFIPVDTTDGEQLVSSCSLPLYGLTLYGMIPQDSLYHDVNGLITWILSLLVLIIVILLFFALHFANSLTEPIKDLSAAMDTASQGVFDLRVPVKSSDEIGLLTAHFNDMLGEINSLIDNVYKQEILKKEAEYQMLEAQINPHFIYIVMDTISWTARANHLDDLSEMVSALSKLLRTSISKKTFVTVSEEVSCVNNYLTIQKFRYKDRIGTVIDVDQELLEIIIPKLILEPLVENAVIHGLEEKEGRGLILVSGRKQGDALVFKVKDTGVGMSKEQIERIRREETAAGTSHTGLGLMTVHNRIQHLYGEAFGIQIESTLGEGTSITLTLPAQETEG